MPKVTVIYGAETKVISAEEGFTLCENLAIKAEQVDLDTDAQFLRLYIESMKLAP